MLYRVYWNWFLWIWSLGNLLVVVGRSIMDHGDNWYHLTNWLHCLSTLFYLAVVTKRAVEYRVMAILPVLWSLTWMVLIAVILMTYGQARVIRQAYESLGVPVATLGNIYLHLLNWIILIIYCTIMEEDILRAQVDTYLAKYKTRGVLSFYYFSSWITTTALTLAYFDSFSPRHYYGLAHLHDVTVILVSFGCIWASWGLFWGWIHWAVPPKTPTYVKERP